VEWCWAKHDRKRNVLALVKKLEKQRPGFKPYKTTEQQLLKLRESMEAKIRRGKIMYEDKHIIKSWVSEKETIPGRRNAKKGLTGTKSYCQIMPASNNVHDAYECSFIYHPEATSLVSMFVDLWCSAKYCKQPCKHIIAHIFHRIPNAGADQDLQRARCTKSKYQRVLAKRVNHNRGKRIEYLALPTRCKKLAGNLVWVSKKEIGNDLLVDYFEALWLCSMVDFIQWKDLI